ncbi:uncharacterized protein SPPG_09541 [Spizellomyces punctatus DAOM BR117]|uniref:C2HC/C3H-type domain-containing protein n=1 Tax=Spizellomyces punctatus (strain DAOM BR117) TaxID=645134 RepID=A0A0L0H4H4_SPIPD|nr:uncharacterized protein SPPG_09541 [Spizellomyces punctatus DAOM BR117]KNC96082.1 hypothetical protein SPPG_09541 [Spizellomyces punctatus DAOM BR117]|eukprot:XP_016604122.1 hypothetical protein SPPG_09541 [Spizellomyces punctatus DAOM BR117]
MDTRVAAKAEGRNPFTRVCYICGREFGSKSLAIHEKQCLAKWDARNALLPKEQRRPRPRPPNAGGSGNDAVAVGGLSTQDYNDAAFATFMDQGREECPNCSRKFLRDRLEVHLRSCKPGGYFAKERQKKPEIPQPTKTIETLSKLQLTSKPKAAASKAKVGPGKASGVSLAAGRDDVASAADGAGGDGWKLAKFCADCGHSFGVAADKFCPSCGLQRLKIS